MKKVSFMPYILAALWFCFCLCLASIVGNNQNGLKLAPSIFFTIDDELRGLLPYCGLKHPQLLFHVNPRFLFGAVQALFTNVYDSVLKLDVFTAFRFTSAIFSSLTVFFLLKTAQVLRLSRFSIVYSFFLLLTSPLFLFFSVSGMETVFCAFLVTLFFYLYLRKSTAAACFILGLAPLVRLETLALCAVILFFCLKEKKLAAAVFTFLPFLLFTIFTKTIFGYDTDKTVYDILVPANFPHREMKDILSGYANLWSSFGDIFWIITGVSTAASLRRGGLRRGYEQTFLFCAAAFLLFLTASYFYSSVYSLCGRYWVALLPSQCLFLASVWQNDMEPSLMKKQQQNRWAMLFPFAIYIAYFYVMGIQHGLPPQNSDNQYVRAPYFTKEKFQTLRARLDRYQSEHLVKTIYATWEFYDSKLFVRNHCEIFDSRRVLWGPTPEGWAYWTKSQELSQKPCNAPYLDFTTMKTRRGLPEEPFILVTTSRWFEKQCPLKIETIFQDTGIRIYSGGLQKR